MGKKDSRYGKVYVREWRRYSRLLPVIGCNTVLVYFYLRTGEHVGMAGVGRLPISYIVGDLDLNYAEVEEIISLLEQHGLILYDRENEEILVFDMVKYQTCPESLSPKDNRIPHIYRQIDELESDRIREAFIERYSGEYYFDGGEVSEAWKKAPS